jgi:hypothetical protein
MTLFIAAPVENRSIVAIALNVEAPRLTNGQSTAFPIHIPGYGTPHCKFSLWPTNPRAIILISELLGRRCVAPGNKGAIAQSTSDFAVGKRLS